MGKRGASQGAGSPLKKSKVGEVSNSKETAVVSHSDVFHTYITDHIASTTASLPADTNITTLHKWLDILKRSVLNKVDITFQHMVREKQRTMTADRLESDKLDERIASLEQEVARSLTHLENELKASSSALVNPSSTVSSSHLPSEVTEAVSQLKTAGGLIKERYQTIAVELAKVRTTVEDRATAIAKTLEAIEDKLGPIKAPASKESSTSIPIQQQSSQNSSSSSPKSKSSPRTESAIKRSLRNILRIP